MSDDPWMVNADDARVLRQDDDLAIRQAYRGGVFPAIAPGDDIDINSAYPAELGCDQLGHALHVIAGVLQTSCLRCDEELAPDQLRRRIKVEINQVWGCEL
jgi:hypothetical protein